MATNNNAYVSGNNAIQLEGKYSQYKTTREKQTKKIQKKSNAENALRSNPIYSVILTGVIISTLAITVILLKTQFIVTDKAEYIIGLQQELVEINKKNDQIRSDINKNIDMDEVYRVATEELGMVQAGKNDIKYVNSDEVAYTVQYNDVEVDDMEKGVNIGNILGFISKGW